VEIGEVVGVEGALAAVGEVPGVPGSSPLKHPVEHNATASSAAGRIKVASSLTGSNFVSPR
jgi:hypothetical protein